ncbi:MAG: hypothetical protein ACTSQE_12265 [Candidatus Heimdallarchaeaceae archaeon]
MATTNENKDVTSSIYALFTSISALITMFLLILSYFFENDVFQWLYFASNASFVFILVFLIIRAREIFKSIQEKTKNIFTAFLIFLIFDALVTYFNLNSSRLYIFNQFDTGISIFIDLMTLVVLYIEMSIIFEVFRSLRKINDNLCIIPLLIYAITRILSYSIYIILSVLNVRIFPIINIIKFVDSILLISIAVFFFLKSKLLFSVMKEGKDAVIRDEREKEKKTKEEQKVKVKQPEKNIDSGIEMKKRMISDDDLVFFKGYKITVEIAGLILIIYSIIKILDIIFQLNWINSLNNYLLYFSDNSYLNITFYSLYIILKLTIAGLSFSDLFLKKEQPILTTYDLKVIKKYNSKNFAVYFFMFIASGIFMKTMNLFLKGFFPLESIYIGFLTIEGNIALIIPISLIFICLLFALFSSLKNRDFLKTQDMATNQSVSVKITSILPLILLFGVDDMFGYDKRKKGRKKDL